MFKRLRICLLVVATAGLILESTPAFASTSAANTNTISPTLVVNVNVQKAISLTLSSGAGCAVTAASDFTVNLGNVDALGINTGACATRIKPVTPGSTNAVYFTDYQVTPIFTSQSVTTNTLTAYVSSTFAKANLSVVQAASLPSVPGDMGAVSTSSSAQTTLASNLTSGTASTSYIGVAVGPSNGANLSGSDTATITYTLTVQ